MAPAMCLGNKQTFDHSSLGTRKSNHGPGSHTRTLLPFSALAFLCGHQLLATDLGPLTIL